MDIVKKIATELEIKTQQVQAVIELIDEGNTIPFIARYRKEKHGSLNDEQLRELDERLRYLRGLEERKESILASIEEQGKLTEELKKQINEAETLVVLEDLYRPYKQKRRTRATIAKEKGLEPLCDAIFDNQDANPEEYAKDYIDEEKEVATVVDALAGAMDILAERISDEADYRSMIRELTAKDGELNVSDKKTSSSDDEKEKSAEHENKKISERKSVYETYHDFSSPIKRIQGYQTLAINRGEREKFLTVKITAPEEEIIKKLGEILITSFDETVYELNAGKQIADVTSDAKALILITILDAYKRL
nr:hypothetical protein [Eubacterium sp.]